ncbi:hypothetical protein [Halorubrum sp. DTA98]|uniref:hypothetical protein n=1 Tax=Halorubrum sp. DTA98 TaxID=3402163 RepID=UPI003AAB1317
MGLLDTLASWLGLRDENDGTEDGSVTDDVVDDEPKLDPDGVTETRVTTTDAAVDALKRTRSEADDTEETDDVTSEE